MPAPRDAGAVETPPDLTADYRKAVAASWATLRLGEDGPGLPLTQLFVLLRAAPKPTPSPLPREREAQQSDLYPAQGRLERAGVSPGEREPAKPPAPVPLGRALEEAPHLVILGEPGAGKTTTLQFLGLCFARAGEGWPQEKLGLAEERVPVYLRLPDVAAGEEADGVLLNALADEVRRRLQVPGEEAARELVCRWAEAPGLLVLLDGLDEVAPEEREAVRGAIGNFARSPVGRGARVVVASRTAGYVSLGEPFRDYILTPLSGQDEVRAFLHNWLAALRPEWQGSAGERAEELLEALGRQPALSRLDTPLLLRLCAEVYAETGEVARNRADLYKRYLKVIWTRAGRRGLAREKREQLDRAAEVLAWHLHNGGGADDESCRAALRRAGLADDDEGARALLEGLRHPVGLVARVGRRRAFAHLTVQEYLVARSLVRRWGERRRQVWRFLRPRLHLPEWQEVLRLMAGLMDGAEAEAFIRHVARAGSRCERRLGRDARLAVALAAERGDISLPLQALEDRRPAVRRAAAEALGALRDERAVEPLLRALEDRRPAVRRAVARALGQLGDARAVGPLLRALEDEDWTVRRATAEALGELGDARAVGPLLRALEDEDWTVRRATAEALGELGDARAVRLLLHALEKGQWAVRWAAAWALRTLAQKLGRMGDEQAVTQTLALLLRALEDEDEDVRRAVAWALGALGDARAVGPLLRALEDEDKNVRRAAARALGELGDARAVGPLLRALEDEDEDVRRAAARALGELGDARAVGPLLRRVLEDEDEGVRRAASRALVELGDAQALEPLLRALEDERWTVRWAAAVRWRRWAHRLERAGTEEAERVLETLVLPLLERAEARRLGPEVLEGPSGVLPALRQAAVWGGVVALSGVAALVAVVLSGVRQPLEEAVSGYAQGQPLAVAALLVFGLAAFGALLGLAVERAKRASGD